LIISHNCLFKNLTVVALTGMEKQRFEIVQHRKNTQTSPSSADISVVARG
jgi:hypothetical protein